MIQGPPNAVQVEFTEGCNLRCEFCAIQGIQEKQGKDYHFMTEETAELIASEIARRGWTPRIEFAMHGEPTLNPSHKNLVAIFRRFLPRTQLMMTSNGGGLLPNAVVSLNELFDAGLNIFAFDAYESVKIWEKVYQSLWPDGEPHQDLKFQGGIYPDNKEMSPHTRRPPNTKLFIWVRDISKATEGTHANITNQGGTAYKPNATRQGQRCAKPFRELSFRWDGRVAICCDDWRGVYKCGSIHEVPIEEIWNGPAMDAARHFLILGQRGALSPCSGCDVRSYRVGLLPDKFGKVKMQPPTEYHRNVADAAVRGQSYTEPVLRLWELGKK